MSGLVGWAKTRPLVVANLAMTPLVAVYSFWLASEHTWNVDLEGKLDFSRFYYWSQARSILRGHLYVVPPDGWAECFTIGGRCFVYLGVTPSFLRMPLIALFHDRFLGLVPVMVACAIGLAFWAAMDLVRQLLEARAATPPRLATSLQVRWFVLVGVLLGPGGILMFIARARAFDEAIAWCAAFLCLALNLVYRWSRSGSLFALGGAVVAGVASASARPSSIPALVVLGLAVLVVGWRSAGRTARILGGSLAILPAAAFMFVFWSKFGSLSFPWKTYGWYKALLPFRRTIDANDGGTVGLRYVLSTLANYLCPDSLDVDLGARAVALKPELLVLPPAHRVQLWGSSVPSLTNVMPAPLVFTGIAFVHQAVLLVRRQVRRAASMPVFLLLAALAGTVPMLMYYAISGRYLGDAYPLMAVGTALALPLVIDFSTKGRWWNRAVFPVLVVVAALCTWILYEIQASAF